MVWAALAGVWLTVGGDALLEPASAVVPWTWAASGLLIGAVLNQRGREARTTTAVGVASVSGLLAATGMPPALAGAVGVALLVEVLLARRLLLAGREIFALRQRSDVFLLIRATTAASAAGTVIISAHLLLVEDIPLGVTGVLALGLFASRAASTMAMLPFFVPSVRPVNAMSARTFLGWAAGITGLTIIVFTYDPLGPTFFATLPMFAWFAFRADLRWGGGVLFAVGAVAVVATLRQTGPIIATVRAFDLPETAATALLMLFLLDCALVMYPVAVIVAEHARAADSAHAGRALLAGVLDGASSVGIVAADRDGRIVLFSEGAARLTGKTSSDVLGLDISALGAPLPAPLDGQDQDPGSSERLLWRIDRADGSTRVLAVAVTATTDAGHRSDGHVITLEDRTEQSAAHQATKLALSREKELVAHLEELDHVKDTFVATVSHELRTPVTSIAGYLEMLADGDAGELSPPQLELLHRATRNSRRLHVLVEDLLLLSRIESRSLTLHPERLDLRELARDVAARVSGQAAANAITIEASGPAWMHGDPAHLERLLGNLVDNAVKFTMGDEPVRIRMQATEKLVQICVSDSGVGIPAAEQASLFTPFFRSTTAVEMATQGAGMGLAIAQAVCHAHGGSIEVQSASGSGTRVSVLLPVAGPNAQAPEAAFRTVPEPLSSRNQAV